MSDLSVAEISAMLRANADTLARQLLPGGRYELGNSEWKCGAKNSPSGDAISVHVAHDAKQGVCGFWNRSPAGGDILDLIEVVHGFGKRDAIGWAEAWLCIGGQEPHATRKNLAQRRRSNRDDEQAAETQTIKLRKAERIWRESGELQGAGADYCRSRGIDPVFADGELRFHEGLPHPEGGTFPAIVARVLNVNAEFVGIWRIYLKMDGSGKAPVECPKLGLGNVKGGAVRIGGVWPQIGIVEGIETALAVRQLVYRQTRIMLPVWASLSTSGMRGLELPDDVSCIRVYADGDAIKFRDDATKPSPGLSAARDLIERVCAAGTTRTYKLEIPPTEQDWLNVLNATEKNDEMRNLPRVA